MISFCRIGSFALSLGVFNYAVPVMGQVLYKHDDGVLFDGQYGPIAKAQERLNDRLKDCKSATVIHTDGRFGPSMQNALREAAKCPALAPKLASDPDGRAGQLTVTYWDILIGGSPPSVDDRARTLVLTYEATDYTRMEWNFCQSKPYYDPDAGHNICYSNDPHSYLTWGPNGATGCGGREIQLILGAIDIENAKLID